MLRIADRPFWFGNSVSNSKLMSVWDRNKQNTTGTTSNAYLLVNLVLHLKTAVVCFLHWSYITKQLLDLCSWAHFLSDHMLLSFSLTTIFKHCQHWASVGIVLDFFFSLEHVCSGVRGFIQVTFISVCKSIGRFRKALWVWLWLGNNTTQVF